MSNYAIEDFRELMTTAIVTPAVNQIEINPFLYRQRTIEFFQSQGVVMQAYRALRDGKAFTHPMVLEVAARHTRSAAQVLGRWCVQKGFGYIPKSTRRERMQENLEVFDFTLTKEDMITLDGLTAPEALTAFRAHYTMGVLRDTPDAGRTDLVRSEITVD